MSNKLFYSYESPLGYQSLENGFDTYGVDHSNFTTRDELEYQNKRVKREEELIQEQKDQGITENFNKYNTNFWGTSPENNYGFGNNNISSNTNTQTQNSTNSTPNCYMKFDGKNLDLYNNELVDSLDAQSGHDNFQNSLYQPIKNKGPIPEGTYYANQDQRQNIDLLYAIGETGSAMLNSIGIKTKQGKWKGGPISWGTKRVWLIPDEKTNTYGRDNFSIHGGLTKGSAGCIDIPWQTDKLSNYLDNCQNSVPVHVNYPTGW